MTRPLRGPLRKRESHLWARHPEDFYVEPAWCDERLFQAESFEGRILDPACGRGEIIKAARAAGHTADGADIQRRGLAGCRVSDFFTTTRHVPNIVSNPPFRFALAFVGHALTLATSKVAMLLPAGWIQAEERSVWLARTSLRRVWLIAPRPSMPPGEGVPADQRAGNGTTDFAWLVWEQGWNSPPEIGWLRRNGSR